MRVNGRADETHKMRIGAIRYGTIGACSIPLSTANANRQILTRRIIIASECIDAKCVCFLAALPDAEEKLPTTKELRCADCAARKTLRATLLMPSPDT